MPQLVSLTALATQPNLSHPAALEFTRRLRHAIASDQLCLHYQPLVRLGDDRIPVVEALVRWNDPERGLLSPGSFIPLAEETGVIEEIGAWALAEACRQLCEWDAAGLPATRVAVNLSARELCSRELPGRVAEALAASGLSADRLEIELTESMFADPDQTADILRNLRAMGVRVAIDDFGTGYSSLGYLTRFSVDVIKVDGAFVRRAAVDVGAAEVVRAIVQMAHQLGLDVVAEGVETVEQLALVRHEGVDLVQGYLFSEPLPAAQFADWLMWARQRADARDAARGGRRSRPAIPLRDRLGRGAAVLAGTAAGALLAAPLLTVPASACPPAGEGAGMCVVQHGYAPAATVFIACVMAALLITRVAAVIPGWVRVLRDPAWHAARRAQPRPVRDDDDPLLIAAAWGASQV